MGQGEYVLSLLRRFPTNISSKSPDWDLFRAVDENNNGQLSAEELRMLSFTCDLPKVELNCITGSALFNDRGRLCFVLATGNRASLVPYLQVRCSRRVQ
jgi:hypothetical protein